MNQEYDYVMAFYDSAGNTLGTRAVEPDFEPALQWATFAGLRQGLVPPAPAGVTSRVEPVWNPEVGEPCLGAFAVTVTAPPGGEMRTVFPSTYFQDLAEAQSPWLIQEGLLDSGEVFQYVLMAVRREPVQVRRPSGRFTVRRTEPAWRITDGLPVGDLLARSAPVGESAEEDPLVFVPRTLIAEAESLAEDAGEDETGGVLIGHLRRAPGSPEVYLEVTAQIPAPHTRAGLTRLTFTPDTWTAVRAAIDLRARDEIMLGWWHSHSFMKSRCEECDRKTACSSSLVFMSATDCALHRTVFPRAYSVALVLGATPCRGMEFGLFGWRKGVVARRGARLIETAARQPAAAGSALGGHGHASE